MAMDGSGKINWRRGSPPNCLFVSTRLYPFIPVNSTFFHVYSLVDYSPPSIAVRDQPGYNVGEIVGDEYGQGDPSIN
jgi:hypothetical protein